MINVYWTENKWKIFWRIFVPYFCYLSLTLYFLFNYNLVPKEEMGNHKNIFATLNLVNLAY